MSATSSWPRYDLTRLWAGSTRTRPRECSVSWRLQQWSVQRASPDDLQIGHPGQLRVVRNCQHVVVRGRAADRDMAPGRLGRYAWCPDAHAPVATIRGFGRRGPSGYVAASHGRSGFAATVSPCAQPEQRNPLLRAGPATLSYDQR